MVVTIIASALISNDYGLCLKQMKLVRRQNSVIENGKPSSQKAYVYAAQTSSSIQYLYTVIYFSVELEEGPEDVVESELQTKIMEELDEYVTVDAIHDECLNAAISFGKFHKKVFPHSPNKSFKMHLILRMSHLKNLAKLHWNHQLAYQKAALMIFSKTMLLK